MEPVAAQPDEFRRSREQKPVGYAAFTAIEQVEEVFLPREAVAGHEVRLGEDERASVRNERPPGARVKLTKSNA